MRDEGRMIILVTMKCHMGVVMIQDFTLNIVGLKRRIMNKDGVGGLS